MNSNSSRSIYRFGPPGYGISVFFTLLGSLAWGQTAPTAAPSSEVKDSAAVEMATMTVTGSNIRMTAAAADKGALPIEFISAERFNFTAGETVTDFLRMQPIVTGNNQTLANSERGYSQTVNLRGLGPDYTLVLVNSRRFAGEGITPDLSIIPAEAIASIEILKSGASAIYGTDAVAGVVNIKLRDRFDTTEVAASYGNTTNRDASTQRYALLFGTGLGKLRFLGSAAWQDHNGVSSADRELTSSRDFRRWGGVDFRSSTLASPQQITGVTGVLGGLSIDVARFRPGQSSRNRADFVSVTSAQRISTNEPGTLPPYTTFGAHWLAEYDLIGKKTILFAQGFYERRKQVFQYLDTGIVQLTVPAGNPNNPFGQSVGVMYQFGRNEALDRVPVLLSDKDSISNTFGLRGDVGAFSYEAAYSHYSQDLVEVEKDNADRAKVQAAVDAGTFNPFGYWSNTSQLTSTLLLDPRTRRVAASLDVWSAKLTGPVFELPTGTVRLAAGAEHRRAGWSQDHDEGWRTRLTSYLAEGPTLGYSRRERSVDAYFAEVQAPVWHPARSGALVTSVDVSAAARYETYGGGNSVTVPQGTLRVGLSEDSLVLRASYAESFRAPSLANLTEPRVVDFRTTASLFDPVRGGNLPYTAITGGNPGLRSEKGENYNAGIVYTPKSHPALTVKTDYWNIKVNDIIVIPNVIDLINGTSPVGSVTRDANLLPTLDLTVANGGEVNASGFDLGAAYRWKLVDQGSVTVDASATYITEFKRNFGATTTNYRGAWTASYGAMPRLRAVLGTLWQRKTWEAAFFLHYSGGVSEEVSIGVRRDIEEYWTGDLQIGYKFPDASRVLKAALRNTRVYVGVENAWDEALTFVRASRDGWDRNYADYRGRYIYVGFRKQL